MLMLFICINLLSVFICVSVLDFSLLVNYSHIFLCFCCYTVVLSCLYQISSCTHVLDLESFYFDSKHLLHVILLTCSISCLLLLWIHGT